MREKIINAVTLSVAFIIGGLFTYYVVVNPIWEDDTTTTINNSNNSNGVVKCDDDITIDETGISVSVGKVYDAVVTVQNYQYNKLAGTGSGFIYKKDSKYGYILTNHHVVENASEIVLIMSDDTEVKGVVLGSDVYLDLAVVRIDVKYVKQAVTVGNSEKSNLGDTVFTVGSPLGYEYRGSVTKGTISGKNRMVSTSITKTESFIMKVIQIDAAINPGNSGGPLLNVNGEVIGINSLKLVQDEIEGMGFAIPIEYAMEYVDDLESGKEIKRPLIGITMVNVTDTMKLYQAGISVDNKLTTGVVVVSTVEGSGAQQAGLQRGDVITKIGNKSVKNSAYLKYELFQYKIGDKVEITYYRNGEEKTTIIVLTEA